MIFDAGLTLDDDTSIDEEIQTESAVENVSFVNDWNLDLPARADASQRKFPARRFLVHGLQQRRTESPMHLDGGANDLARQFITADWQDGPPPDVRLCVDPSTR